MTCAEATCTSAPSSGCALAPPAASALEAILEYDVRGRLGAISCPALIVWGADDRLITVRDAERFAEGIRDSRKVVYPDTGHMAMLERPREFNELLRDFLDS